jgi:hypothetical protein
MPVGSGQVIDYVNTTSGLAREVIANDRISGAGVEVRYTNTPISFNYIVTEGSDDITTEGGDLLITQS